MDSVVNRGRQVPAEETPAFGGIAERFRRAGALDRAVALCREGLQKFPDHLSARVTLGWSLLDQGKYDEAQVELEQVLKRAPDNLAAIRGLAELHERAENAVELSLDGPGPWPPDAEAIKGAAPPVAPPSSPNPVHAVGDTPTPPSAAPVAAEPARSAPVEAVASLVETPAQAVARKTEPSARAAAEATPPTPVELTTFADLVAEPAVHAAPSLPVPAAKAPVPEAQPEVKAEPALDLAEENAEALLRALDELEGNAVAATAESSTVDAVIDLPVGIEPALDELVGALDSAAPASEPVSDEPVVEVTPVEAVALESAPVESALVESAIAETALVEAVAIEPAVVEAAAIAPAAVELAAVESAPVEEAAIEPAVVEVAAVETAAVETAPVEDAVVEVAAAEPAAVEVAEVAEVSDGFALTAEAPSDAVAEEGMAAAEQSEQVGVADTHSRSFDFETIPPVPVPVPVPIPVAAPVPAPIPVPAGPPPLAARQKASLRILERMLTRVHTRRVEVASEYHRAS